MKPKRAERPPKATRYLVLWWMAQTPYAAVFTNEVAAEAAASVRNALLVEVSGREVSIDRVVDWYRRDEGGRPMPAEWRALLDQGNRTWPAHAVPTA